MNKPILDIVLLLLVVVVFGVHQRRRPHLYFRFWVAGWGAVFLSYGVWEIHITNEHLRIWQDAVRYDLTLAGGMFFALSFLVTRQTLRRTLLAWAVIVLGASAAVDIQLFTVLRPEHLRPLLMVLILVAHVAAAFKTLMDRSKHRNWSLVSILAIITLFGIAMLRMVYQDPNAGLEDIGLCEVFLCAALLHASSYRGLSLVGVLGTLGLGSWSIFYVLGNALQIYNNVFALHLLWSFWNLPKYLVGLHMILKIVEEERDEKTVLAQNYASMYEDFRLMFDYNPHPALIYAESSGQFLLANKAAVECYGYSEQEFLARRIQDFELAADADFESVEAQLPAMNDGYRACVRHRDGHKMWVAITGHSIHYKDVNAQLVIVRDVDKRVQVDLEMLQRANHDALTGLPNRRLLDDRMGRALERSIRDTRMTAVMTIDIDHFKKVNDTYGHLVGDECLKAVAARLDSKIRSIDTLARIGGEEFVAVIGGLSNGSDAERIAQDLLQLFATPLQLSTGELKVTVSIGVAMFPADGYDAETLKQRSDEALYAAKEGGRNRFVSAGGLLLGAMTQPQEPLNRFTEHRFTENRFTDGGAVTN